MELTTIGENKYGKWNLQALLNNADFIRENIQYGNAVDIKDMVTNWIQQ